MMKIAVASSSSPDGVQAVEECFTQLGFDEGNEPSWMLLFHSDPYDSGVLAETLVRLAGHDNIHGGTSCLGVMTRDGFCSHEGRGIGIFAVSDPDGSYGVGAARLSHDPVKAAVEALEKALLKAGRVGEVPAFVWINAAPGFEEELLSGIESVVGPHVPIAGGSTADNEVAGNWSQIAGCEVFEDAVVVSVFFPSTETSYAFHSGYDPTETSGVVTRAGERTIYEIDGKPAAEVYNEWSQGTISPWLSEGGNILAATTLTPLGREVGVVGGIPFFKLSHPSQVDADGAISLFSDIQEGERIVLMHGSRESLVSRAGRVTGAAISAGDLSSDSIAGALVIYCAGCMLTVQGEMEEVAAGIKETLGGAPFLGTFTFGEQGSFVNRENSHGNLMISVVVFSTIPSY